MDTITLDELEIKDNIKFLIKYCDSFMDYCHNENLSIDGNIAGEIVDSITEIEDYLEDKSKQLEIEDLKNIYEYLVDIHDGLTSLCDINIFNDIHIVYQSILSDTKEKLLKHMPEDDELE